MSASFVAGGAGCGGSILAGFGAIGAFDASGSGFFDTAALDINAVEDS